MFNNNHSLMTAMRLGSVLRLQLPVWAGAMVAAATVGERVLASMGGMGVEVELCIGCGAAAGELNGHKKTVSESETVAGQY